MDTQLLTKFYTRTKSSWWSKLCSFWF